MLDQKLMDLLNPYLASININAVKALQINDAGEEIKAEIMVPTKEEMTADPEIKESFRVNGWNADITSSGSEHYFKQFYRSLIALQIDGVDRRAPEDYAADFKIMYTLKSKYARSADKKPCLTKKAAGRYVWILPSAMQTATMSI